MITRFFSGLFVLLGIAVLFPIAVLADTPSSEEMWEIIQQQQKVIEELKAKLEQTENKVAATETRVDTTVKEIEAAAEAMETARTGASTAASWTEKTTIGGYGELHYNSLNDDNASIGGDDDVDSVDFHRFVLYFGHEFTDSIRFFSELELEHALVDDNTDGSEAGEVELEQAWVELDFTDQHRARAGLDILPIGIINPTHEPNTFYGVERNKIETEIIPTTWWEAGLGMNGEIVPGWNYDLIAHSGLVVPTTGSSAFRPRSGRLKVSEAADQDIAFTGRIRYTGMPGLEVGASGQYQRDITGTADLFEIPATLFEGHVDWKHATGFGLRALYARWDMGDDNSPFPGLDPDAVNADSLDGWYVEPAYRFAIPGRVPGDLGLFARYENWDERNQISGAHRFEEFARWVLGINWWPHDQVAFKFDIQNENADGPVDRVLDGVNLGIGYQF
ncbi:MAG: porin [Gammaproteobacteria bacterium]|nr:porin [Gammaproteobacteria bacterium]